MNKQRAKIAVAFLFIAIIACIGYYFNSIKRKSGKVNITGYKTDFNPSMLDSIENARTSEFKKQKEK